MNVIIANEQQQSLSTLDIDIIKTVTGSYEAREIVEMFKNFFFNKMILDVTAIKGYDNPDNYQILAQQLDPEKVVLYIPENSKLCTATFLARIITYGLYNFTTNIDGIKYLLQKSNTYKDVEHIQQMAGQSLQVAASAPTTVENKSSVIIGFRSITDNAGSTTLIYMLKKELEAALNTPVLAIEVDKRDFMFFNQKNMLSVSKDELKNLIASNSQAPVILIDLNAYPHDEVCHEVFYLIEPSIIKLNKLIRREPSAFNRVRNKKVILNKSLLSSKDISDFEMESNIRVAYNMPPLDERQRNGAINDFLVRTGLISQTTNNDANSGRVFGLFRK